jgi:Putative transposase
MICQSIKREQWVDKLKSKLLKVPYVHSVFTLPHQLNSLARNNESLIYSLIMKVAWLTIKSIGAKSSYTPGMTSILHTFGSDMKYHIHVHALVTFGGMSKDGAWIYPKEKHKLDKYRSICASYKAIFVKELRSLHKSGKINYHNDFEILIAEVENIRWVVHSTRPTMDTKIIEDYLAKYINRIAVSNKRLDYIKDSEKVILLHNDYKNQQVGQVAPKAFKIMEPLVAIDQILQHVLPPYFQKSRSYGIHNHACKLKTTIPDAVKRNSQTIRTVFEIITELMKLHPYKCEKCGSDNHFIEEIKPDKTWILTYINIPTPRPPPQFNSFQKPIPR